MTLHGCDLEMRLPSVDGHSSVYGYDAAGQLMTITTGEGTTTLAYDHAGRRVSETGPGRDAAYTYDPRGRLSAVTVQDGGTVTTVERGWDAEDRLVSVGVSVDGGPATVTGLWWDPLPAVARVARIRQDGGAYAHNDPLGLVDPLGLRPWSDADARCWLLHGSCGEVLGDIDQASRGVIDIFGGMLAGVMDVVLDPASVAEAFEQAYHEAGGGWRGRYEAANLLNPVYHVLVSGDACLQANHGTIDVRATAGACTEFTVTTAGTVAGTAATARATLAARRSLAPRMADDLVDLASPGRRTHILQGDATGGGHLWPGAAGKTPFPRSWSGDRIMHEISDIATDPSAWRGAIPQGSRTVLTGTRRGVDIPCDR